VSGFQWLARRAGVAACALGGLLAGGCITEADDGAGDAGAPEDAGDATDAGPMADAAPEADAAPPAPDAAPAPLPPDASVLPAGLCEGRYAVSSWVVVDAGFDASAFSTFLTDALSDGALRLAAVTVFEADALTLTITQVDADGLPLPGAPVGEPLRLGRGADGRLATVESGVVAFHVAGRIGGYAVDLDARFENARLTGRFGDDCGLVGGRLDAAFSAANLSLPVPPDTDLDGDGTNDAYRLGSNVQAVRVR
jgi:hypothetical protein